MNTLKQLFQKDITYISFYKGLYYIGCSDNLWYTYDPKTKKIEDSYWTMYACLNGEPENRILTLSEFKERVA